MINQNQIRDYGHVVEDVPKIYDPSPLHPIVAKGIRINLKIDGCISDFPFRTPTTEELNECPHIVMTGPIGTRTLIISNYLKLQLVRKNVQ